MFRGTYEHPIDEKGRVSVPLKFREQLRLNERLIVTNFVVQKAHCLQAFPFDAWIELENRLRAKPQFDPRFTVFRHFFLGGAHECQIDNQGRILLPPRLRDYASLAKDVVFSGELELFSIWDRESWSQVFEAGKQLLVEDPGFLAGL